MKSQQSDPVIQTSCKDCAFAIVENNKQKSCVFDRIQKFGPSTTLIFEDKDLEYYKINRVCNYYRNTAWGYSKEDADKVAKESSTSFDIIFDCDNIDENSANYIREFILNNNYPESRKNILLTHHNDNYSNLRSLVIDIITPVRNNHKVDISINYDLEFYLHSFVKKSKSNYHCVVTNPETLNADILQKINNLINEDLSIIISIDHGGNFFIHNLAYKVLQHFQENTSYSESITKIIDDAKHRNIHIEI